MMVRSQVHYTGLECHPDYDIHMAQASGGGSVVCFRTGDLAFSQHIVTVRDVGGYTKYRHPRMLLPRRAVFLSRGADGDHNIRGSCM